MLDINHAAREARPPRRPVTPLARRIAQAHGVDLGGITGSGPGGRICAADVRALVDRPSPPLASPPLARHPLSAAARGAGGEVSANDAGAGWAARPPIATVTFELDASAALAAAEAAREPAGRAPLPVDLTAVVVEAAAGLLPAHPELNGAWGGELAVLRRRVHVAVGEIGPDGSRWAVVRHAGDLSPRGVARALARGEGRRGEATFAVFSLARGASWQSAAPPLPGTAAALSVGAPARRAVAVGDSLAVRPVATLTLSYDARLIDHRRAAAFLRELRAKLERGSARAAAERVL